MKKRSFYGRVVGLVIAALLSGNVAAEIEEVVVTAQKREQNAQDVGIAVAAFGEDQIRSLGITSADQIAESVSGVQIYHYRGKGQPSFVIRGVGTQDFAPNTAPTAAVYLDEVYLGSNVVTGFQIFDVHRVEVLKGPQGTLFGRNTTGGAINYTTNRPTDVFEASVQMGYDNFDTTTVESAIGGAVSENARMRLALKYSDQGEGYYDNDFNPGLNPFGPSPNFSNLSSDVGQDENWAVRWLTEVDLGGQGTLLLNLHGGGRDSDTLPVTPIGFTTIPGSGGVCAATATGGGLSDPRFCGDAFGYSDLDGEEYDFRNDYVGENEESNVGASIRLEWDFDTIALTSVTAFERAEKERTADADGSPFFVFNNVTDIEFEQVSQELRITPQNGDPLFWILGLYVSHDEIDQDFCGDLNPLLGLGVACRNQFSQITDNAAIYGQAEYFLTDQLRVTFGLRLTHERRDFESVNTFTDALGNVTVANFGLGPEDAAIIDDEVSNTNLSGRLGLDYFYSEDVLLYASYSRGYKSGGYDGDFSFTRQQLDPYDEETIGAFELGWKTTFADGLVRFNGAAFYYDYSAPQIRVQRVSNAGLPFNQLINLDSADVYGLEADLIWAPTEQLDIRASVTLLDTEIDERSADPALALFDGNAFALAAEESFTLMATYTQPLSDRLLLTVQVDGKYNGEYELNAENLPWLTQDAYTLVNSRISLLDSQSGLEVSVWGKNLSDETFAVGSYSLFGAFPVSYNTPRTFGITARIDI